MRLIDADALKKEYLDKFWKACEDEDGIFDAIGAMEKIIDQSPTIIVPVAELDTTTEFAEWIDRSDGGRIRYSFWERYECSKCGARSDNTNFCPNCGKDTRPRILDAAVDGAGKDGNVKEGEAE